MKLRTSSLVAATLGATVAIHVAVAEAQTVYIAQPAPTYAVVAPPPDHGRFRFGINVGGGYFLASGSPGTVSGGSIDGALRLGWQFNHRFAVYYQGAGIVGIAAGVANNGQGYGGVAAVETNAVMAEYTVGNLLQLGLGPSLDYVGGVICAGSECLGTAGATLGGDARIALAFGRPWPGRRRGFALSLDLHPTLVPGGGAFFFGTLNLGYEME